MNLTTKNLTNINKVASEVHRKYVAWTHVGEMLNVGSDSNPHWVSKQVLEIVMKVSEKYYPNAKK